MTDANLSQLWARVLIEELVRGGVRHAVVCPGSRSSPLALACAEQLTVWPVVDERSAAFFALGMAKESGRAVAVLATSGTAGAHFFPAIIEAHHSHTPMVVLTADRPPELQGFGAAQTISQQGLYGSFVRQSADLGVPELAMVSHLRAVVSRAVALGHHAPRGVVHLNVPFREPLAPLDDASFDSESLDSVGREGRGGAPFLELLAHSLRPSPEGLARLKTKMASVERGLLVCGPRAQRDGLREALVHLGRTYGFPVFAEALSQARFGGAEKEVISLYDPLLRHKPFAETHTPELIVRMGGGLTSKALQNWLDGSGAECVLLSEDGEVVDPAHAASLVLEGDVLETCRALTDGVTPRTSSWLDRFANAQTRARAALEQTWASRTELGEPQVAREVARALPARAQLFVSSSMPVRDLESFGEASSDFRVLANRGVNGIDGILSSALGVAASSGKPTVLLTGDLAVLHDLGGLVLAAKHRLPLTVVLLNNDGGGIFSFLPIAQATEHFERLFGTPHGLAFDALAKVFGARHAVLNDASGLRKALQEGLEGGLHLLEVRTERGKNVEDHRTLFQAVADALGKGPWR